jgi:hypothetical protein
LIFSSPPFQSFYTIWHLIKLSKGTSLLMLLSGTMVELKQKLRSHASTAQIILCRYVVIFCSLYSGWSSPDLMGALYFSHSTLPVSSTQNTNPGSSPAEVCRLDRLSKSK